MVYSGSHGLGKSLGAGKSTFLTSAQSSSDSNRHTRETQETRQLGTSDAPGSLDSSRRPACRSLLLPAAPGSEAQTFVVLPESTSLTATPRTLAHPLVLLLSSPQCPAASCPCIATCLVSAASCLTAVLRWLPRRYSTLPRLSRQLSASQEKQEWTEHGSLLPSPSSHFSSTSPLQHNVLGPSCRKEQPPLPHPVPSSPIPAAPSFCPRVLL